MLELTGKEIKEWLITQVPGHEATVSGTSVGVAAQLDPVPASEFEALLVANQASGLAHRCLTTDGFAVRRSVLPRHGFDVVKHGPTLTNTQAPPNQPAATGADAKPSLNALLETTGWQVETAQEGLQVFAARQGGRRFPIHVRRDGPAVQLFLPLVDPWPQQETLRQAVAGWLLRLSGATRFSRALLLDQASGSRAGLGIVVHADVLEPEWIHQAFLPDLLMARAYQPETYLLAVQPAVAAAVLAVSFTP